jgi:hypothetical protein
LIQLLINHVRCQLLQSILEIGFQPWIHSNSHYGTNRLK